MKMDFEKISELIKTGEGYTIEFKKSVSSSLSKEICAFANASGGKIIIGVNNDGKIVKNEFDNDDLSQIQDYANNLDPSIKVNIDMIKNVLLVYVPEGKKKPYRSSRGFYLRVGANSQKLSRDEIKELFQKENHIKFERKISFDFDYSEIDTNKYKEYLKNAQISNNLSQSHVLRNLNLLTDNKLNNAAILFFGKNVYKYFLNSSIICGLYKGNSKNNILDRKEFKEDLINNFEKTFKWIQSKLNTNFIIKGTKRIEKLEIPEEVIRELLLNAIVHRDYMANGHVQVDIFIDRFEISNPGSLLFDKEELGNISATRNPIIQDLMYRANYVEKIGSGINRIKKILSKEKLNYKFKISSNYFRVVVSRKSDNDFLEEKSESNENRTKIERKSNARKRRQWILDTLKSKGQIKNKDIREHFDIAKSTAYEDLKNLIEEDKIVKKGSGSNVWYELKMDKNK
ncbi:MAG: DeoR family transcriptional regulator [Candidatus Mcinerneyibacterium aminivorans]|uniref:DeoR family transcriptional regulator n=1 Tax=Candidatus Mcinerneyibacterium aminivorans TaxID=2703815 RepID=A0A5D0MG78_9BACT|nr:MAG: DeoR family transcriptional regulator [Candidatus Mcinerneyibacterium aminivorans]